MKFSNYCFHYGKDVLLQLYLTLYRSLLNRSVDFYQFLKSNRCAQNRIFANFLQFLRRRISKILHVHVKLHVGHLYMFWLIFLVFLFTIIKFRIPDFVTIFLEIFLKLVFIHFLPQKKFFSAADFIQLLHF